MRAPNAPPPPPPTLDANGCRFKQDVEDGCCNSPIEGPRFENNQCCYGWEREGGCCGRPFLVAGRARVADVVRTNAWLTDDICALQRDAIDPHTTRALADAWLADAQMEHASIAAFARFVLQLVSLGAPASLVRDAAAAAVDEQRHAELCFSIASELAGRPLGAAALAVSDALSSWSLGEVIAEVVVEGCIGETVAALIALRQLEGATEPNVRRVLEQIATDESRHAELAWRFLRWAIDVGGEPAREAARLAFATAVVSSPVAVDGVDAIAWRTFGRLTAQERAAVERSAHDDVIGTSARALLARSNESYARAADPQPRTSAT
jgi:hypothetical protein